MLKEVAERETDKNLRFKIVEKGGRTIERSLMRPNPIGSEGCGKKDCPVCEQEGGGKLCHKCNICYYIKCRKCDGAIYYGESHRNLYTRGREHKKRYEKSDEGSFMHRHQVDKHKSD